MTNKQMDWVGGTDIVKKRYRSYLLAVGILLAMPSAAWANMGTPMMWATIFHLGIGNVVIGLIEGLMLSFWFKVSREKAVALMVVANYFSAIIGCQCMVPLKTWLESRLVFVPLYDAPRMILAMVIIFYLATILFEYPFCLLILRSSKQNRFHLFRKTLLASLVVQTVSYALLVLYYSSVTQIDVYKHWEIDRGLSFTKNSDAKVFYISPDGDVWKINIDGTQRQRVLDANIKEEYSWLFVRKSPDSAKWDLWVVMSRRDNLRKLIPGFSQKAAPRFYEHGSKKEEDLSMYGKAADLRPKDQRNWQVISRFFSYAGLFAKNSKTGATRRVRFDTPFASWNTSCATVLPGDLVVFQMDEQILVLDLNKRKIGFLAMGRGPVVGME